MELKPKDAGIIRMRHGLGVNDAMTLDEIGRRFEVTRERIRQLESKAIRHLQHPVRLAKFSEQIHGKPDSYYAEVEAIVMKEEDELKTDGSVRDIQMNDLVFDALQGQFKVTGKTSDFVFCNRNGTPIDNQNFLNRVWSPLLRHLDIPHRRAYQMRHTAATLWLASGEAPEWIARQLGHTSTEMLFRVYSRYVPNLTRRDGSVMERLLKQHISVTPVRGIVVQLPEERPAITAKGSGAPTDETSSTGAINLACASDAGNGECIRALDELGPGDEAITRTSAADLRRRRAPDDSTSLMSLIKRPELPAFLKQD